MSDEQYEEFYWPTLKRLLLGLVDEGLLVWVFTQGKYDSRLHHFKEIPSGTCLIHLESGTDAFLAKEVLAGSQCIEGNVSSALLAAAPVDEVEAYCLKLAEVCGAGGGFMMDFSAFLDEAKRENVKKMIEVARRHGASGESTRESGGGGGNRTRVHGRPSGVSTGLAVAFDLARGPRVGRVPSASPDQSQVRSLGTARPHPSPLDDTASPGRGPPGAMRHLIT